MDPGAAALWLIDHSRHSDAAACFSGSSLSLLPPLLPMCCSIYLYMLNTSYAV